MNFTPEWFICVPDADRMNKLVFTVMRGLGEFPVGICNAALRFYVGKKMFKIFHLQCCLANFTGSTFAF